MGSVKKSLRGADNYGKGGAKCPANAYTEQPLSRLMHFEYRLYSGKPNSVEQLYYFKNLMSLSLPDDALGVFLGIIEFEDNQWIFHNLEKPFFSKELSKQFEEQLSIFRQDVINLT